MQPLAQMGHPLRRPAGRSDTSPSVRARQDYSKVLVCWSLTSLCHSNGHIETMPAREINPFTALTRIRSQFLRTQWSTSNHQRVDTTTPQTAEPSGLGLLEGEVLHGGMGYNLGGCPTTHRPSSLNNQGISYMCIKTVTSTMVVLPHHRWEIIRGLGTHPYGSVHSSLKTSWNHPLVLFMNSALL